VTDKELTDRVVALGVSRFTTFDQSRGHVQTFSEEDFVRDWRVAGAMIERVGNVQTSYSALNFLAKTEGADWVEDGSMPRAIIRACLGEGSD